MNKLLALTLLGFVLIALAGAEGAKETVEVEALESREARAVTDNKKKEKGAKLAAKKDKKKTKGAKEGKKAAAKHKAKKTAKKSKSQKSAKKQKKSQKGKKQAKKHGKKVTKHGKKSLHQGRQSTGCLPTTCLDTAVIYLNLMRGKAATLNAQVSRITKLNSSGAAKGKKTNNFNPALGLLVDAAGGNSSAPTCGSATSGAGVNQITNLTAVLSACPTTIAAACALPSLPPTVSNCSATLTRFATNVNNCLNQTVNATADPTVTCACWNATNLSADVPTIKSCNLADSVNTLANVSANCTAAVAKCTKYQQAVPSTMQACNQNPSALLSKLSSLTANQGDATKVQAKIASLTSGSGKMAVNKRAPSTSCTGVASDAATYIKTLNDNPASTNLPTLASNVYNAGSVTCSASDIASLNTAAASIATAIAAIVQQIAATQASLSVLTGTTASAAAISAAPACSNSNCNPAAALVASTTASVVTKPAGHRRRRVVEEILREKLM